MRLRNITQKTGRYGVFTWSILQDVMPHGLRQMNGFFVII